MSRDRDNEEVLRDLPGTWIWRTSPSTAEHFDDYFRGGGSGRKITRVGNVNLMMEQIVAAARGLAKLQTFGKRS